MKRPFGITVIAFLALTSGLFGLCWPTLAIGHAEPEDKSDWLPVPDGPFALALRIYWPEQDILDGKWTPSPIRRMEKHVGRVSYPPSGGTLRVEICPTCSGSHPHRTAP